jgi:ribosome-associated protein
MEGKELALAVCKALSDKKAHDIVTVNVADQTVMCSYFVIASGTSTTQVRALGDYVEEELEKQGLTAVRKEGLREGRWGVLDYGDVIVHIFNDESRLFYYLERLWDSGRNVEHYKD